LLVGRPLTTALGSREHLRLIELIDPENPYLGITGGEPTLLKDDLLTLIAK